MTSLKPTPTNIVLQQYLRSVPFLGHASEEELAYLCDNSDILDPKRFEIIYHKGDPSEHIYFVIQGMVKISAHQSMGKEVIRTICHSGMIFGEGSLNGEKLRSAMSQALDRKSSLIRIKAESLRTIMMQNSNVCIGLFDVIGARLRSNQHRLESVIVEDAKTRVINFLKDNAELYGNKVGLNELLIKHNFTQQDIADFTGTSRQTVTTILNDLKRSNIISMNRRRILIRDAAVLGI